MDGGYLPKLHYLLRQPTVERIIIMSSANMSLDMTDDAPERKIQVLFFSDIQKVCSPSSL